jgi:hypothetical protein
LVVEVEIIIRESEIIAQSKATDLNRKRCGSEEEATIVGHWEEENGAIEKKHTSNLFGM